VTEPDPEGARAAADAVEEEPAASLEEIDRDGCFALVRSMSVGRIAVALPGGPPLVVPVNYAVDGEVVVFRSDPGSKLLALREQPVSFQVDAVDPFHRTGWSVLIQGVAVEAVFAEVEHLAVESWAGATKHWVRVLPAAVTGRRIHMRDFPVDTRGYL
jgi:nitroimidazol reductase NimA-like FMN-containing flavoprotein (pyridoxamine 5'-phosphate oxidase superfamily)